MAEQRALSQWEIDALLDDLPTEGGAPALELAARARPVPSASPIKSYDFRRPDKFSKDQWATLQSMYEHFARQLAASFSSRLRTLVTVRLSALEQGLYEEWQARVPNPAVCYVMGMRPLSGNLVIEFGGNLAAEVIDRLLGGNGAFVDPSRELGEVEFGLLRSFSRTFSHSLQGMWSAVRPVEPSLQDVGQDASLIQVAAPTDVVVSAFFELNLGNRQGAMSLCLPYAVIEPVAPSLSAQLWMASSQRSDLSAEEREVLERLVDRSPLELAVELGSVELPARTIAGLQEGDTIILDARLGRPLSVLIGDRPRFLALPGVLGSHLGVQIADVVEQELLPALPSRTAARDLDPKPELVALAPEASDGGADLEEPLGA